MTTLPNTSANSSAVCRSKDILEQWATNMMEGIEDLTMKESKLVYLGKVIPEGNMIVIYNLPKDDCNVGRNSLKPKSSTPTCGHDRSLEESQFKLKEHKVFLMLEPLGAGTRFQLQYYRLGV